MSKGKEVKPHIGIFGRRNNGKSSFINLLVGQDLAAVSSLPGTTTGPENKSVEIFGIGPAILIDTAGIDDTGELGEKRIKKTMEVIK
ncbi:MAG TPA: GTPase, partial [Paludibacter sp.]